MVRLRFRIHLPSGAARRVLLVLMLLPVLLLGTVIVGRVRATAPDSPPAPSASAGMRQYYVYPYLVQPNQARSVCATGYHFAAIWEIADPSSLRYNTELGFHSPDSGEGPPTTISFMGAPLTVRGWVRTGYSAWAVDIPGQANCNAWLSNNEFDWGTVVNLPSNWTGGEQDLGVWNAEVRNCDSSYWVWCVQDDSISQIYLPVVLRR